MAILCALNCSAQATQPQAGPPKAPARPVSQFALTTTSFEDGGVIPEKFSEPLSPSGPPATPAPQHSPQLAWSRAPDATASFVLVMEDANNNQNHRTDPGLHWMMFNIPAAVHELPEGLPTLPQLPDGSIQVMNRKIAGYLGPGAQASGPYHHYTFSLYALDTMLTLGTATPPPRPRC